MASIAILIIIAGCIALLYLKGTMLRAFASFMAAVSASIITFAWFEPAAGLLISQDTLTNWAQPLCFIVLFIIAFAILQTLVITLVPRTIDLGVNAERAGRIVFGLLLGFVISGVLLTAGAMAPLSADSPYQRFESSRPNPENPKKPFLNPDGFITRWFSIISSGSLSGRNSFAVLHAGFLDQLYLNRLQLDKDVTIFADSGTIKLPDKAAAWPALEGLKDNKGSVLSSKTGYELIMARIGITSRIKSFNTGQLRLICKEKSDEQALQGSAVSIYPIGYLQSPGRVRLTGLADQITLGPDDFKQGVRWIDFAFYVPTGYEPVVVGFKANIIAKVPPMVSADEAPAPEPLIRAADYATSSARVTPVTSAKVYGLELSAADKFLQTATSAVADQNEWTTLQTQQSLMPARFEQGQIICVRAEMRLPAGQTAQPSGENNLPRMLKPAAGYKLLSLKCNNPAAGSAIVGDQLPVLIDSTSAVHRPCGLLAAGKVNNITTFEFDYCSQYGNIKFDKNGAVAKPFPDTMWLTEKAQSISELYIIYQVKPATIITSVRPAGAAGAKFEQSEAFLVK